MADRTVEISMAGEGAPLIVLESGLGEDASAWSHVFGELAARSRTLAYSRPGFGRSTAAMTARTAKIEARELRDLLLALNAEPPFLLVGHSWGGLIVEAFANAYPEEMCGLVLLDPTHPHLIERMRSDTPDDLRTFERLVKDLQGAARQELDALRAMRTDNTSKSVVVTAPVIVLGAWLEDLHGSASYLHQHRTLLRETTARFAGAELRRIPCKHHIQREQPHAVIEAVEDILRRRV
jgi:pimeloyl-ACP methyl ester carboxylesterase